MSCEAQRERLALRLYDELDASEDLLLEDHLASCAACRAFADELRDGLGALVPPAPIEVPDWDERLRAATRGSAAPLRRLPSWTGLAAGFAAGLLVAGLLGGGETGVGTGARTAVTQDAFELDEPPPRARTHRRLAAAIGWLGRDRAHPGHGR